MQAAHKGARPVKWTATHLENAHVFLHLPTQEMPVITKFKRTSQDKERSSGAAQPHTQAPYKSCTHPEAWERPPSQESTQLTTEGSASSAHHITGGSLLPGSYSLHLPPFPSLLTKQRLYNRVHTVTDIPRGPELKIRVNGVGGHRKETMAWPTCTSAITLTRRGLGWGVGRYQLGHVGPPRALSLDAVNLAWRKVYYLSV